MATPTRKTRKTRTAGTARTERRDIGAEIIEGLELAIRHERGEDVGARTKEVSARNAHVDPAPQFGRDAILALRQRFRMTQPVFAQLLSVSPETVKGWEQGKFTPQGAANRLLQVCQDFPDAILGVAHLMTAGGSVIERRAGGDRRRTA